jgi:hypothetical protein
MIHLQDARYLYTGTTSFAFFSHGAGLRNSRCFSKHQVNVACFTKADLPQDQISSAVRLSKPLLASISKAGRSLLVVTSIATVKY